jgi:hypothetical protein
MVSHPSCLVFPGVENRHPSGELLQSGSKDVGRVTAKYAAFAACQKTEGNVTLILVGASLRSNSCPPSAEAAAPFLARRRSWISSPGSREVSTMRSLRNCRPRLPSQSRARPTGDPADGRTPPPRRAQWTRSRDGGTLGVYCLACGTRLSSTFDAPNSSPWTPASRMPGGPSSAPRASPRHSSARFVRSSQRSRNSSAAC